MPTFGKIAGAVVLVSLLMTHPARAAQAGARTIEGTVTTFDGKPIAGAEVAVINQIYSHVSNFRVSGVEVLAKTTSDAQGAFHLSLPPPPSSSRSNDKEPQRLLIRATADGYAYGGVGYQLDRPGSGDQPFFDGLRQEWVARPAIVLPPAARIAGTVTDADTGKPIAGVNVDGDSITNPVKTDAQGRYVLEKIKPTYFGAFHDSGRVFTHHDDFVDAEVLAKSVEASKETTIDIALRRGVLLTGTMTDDQTGKPLKYQGVMVRDEASVVDQSWSAWSDAGGKYQLRIPSGERDVAMFPCRGGGGEDTNYFPLVDHRTVRSNAGDTKVTADFAFHRGSVIEGTLHLPAGARANQFYIEARPTGQPRFTTSQNRYGTGVDAAGKFRIQQLRGGRYDLVVIGVKGSSVSDELLKQPMTVKADDRLAGIVLDLPADVKKTFAASMHGIVRLPDGKPAANAKLNLKANDTRDELTEPGDAFDRAGEFGLDAYSAPDGSFDYKGIDRARKWTLWVRDATDSLAAVMEFKDAAALDKPIEITLEPGMSISGKILSGEGKPITGYRVALAEVVKHGEISSHRPLYSTRTDAAGNYTLKAVVLPLGKENFSLEANPDLLEEHTRKRMIQNQGYDNQPFKPNMPLTGYDFRVEESDSLVRVTPAHAAKEIQR